jgi:hypothetical protein
MYSNTNLQNYLETSSSVSLQSIVLGEWNLNFADNVEAVGNYRYRPNIAGASTSNFGQIREYWKEEDVNSIGILYYYGATDADIVTSTGIDLSNGNPTVLKTKNKTEEILYSLTDVLSKFRPRSGINKVRFFGDNYINSNNSQIYAQPRFYMASKDDQFKYWNSYRVEATTYSGIERGIAKTATGNGDYYIDDAAPFVVYTDPVPANRLVFKMQTGVGDVNLDPTGTKYKKSNDQPFADPFYENPTRGSEDTPLSLINQKTPTVWRVQTLNPVIGTDPLDSASRYQWQTVKTFTLNEKRPATGKRIIGSDGYVELAYGINNLPTTYGNNVALTINIAGEFSSQYILPINNTVGEAYLVPSTSGLTAGTVYYWTNNTTPLGDGAPIGYSSFVPTYGWFINEESANTENVMVNSLTDPKYFGTLSSIHSPTYREFAFIKGIRLVVDRMTQKNSSLDLIEMSPRLAVDLTDKTTGFSIDKIASDIGETGIPVGKLTPANGSLSLFDYDQSFNEYNDLTLSNGVISGSLISNISTRNLQVKFYEKIIDPTNPVPYVLPMKTMYAEGVPEIKKSDRQVSIPLRDFFFYFETLKAPLLLLRHVNLSSAVSILLDNVGFSNYKFYRNVGEAEDKIPYFFVSPDKTVAEVLNDLATSTQTAMFFDEYNNFITMSKNRIMPTKAEYLALTGKEQDITLYGTNDFNPSNLYGSEGAVENYYDPYNADPKKLANILSLESEDNVVYNSGKITYVNRYIQKSYSTIKEASMLNKSQNYKYKPVLLWEVSGTEQLRTTNDEVGNQSSYSLSAIALNNTLTAELPYIDKNGVIQNNIMNFGDSIYWLSRYSGYFYSNSEIIKYNAVEYSVSGVGNVWIESVSDYEKYFGELPFNGKIFPTGRVRIYAEPYINNDGTVNVLTKYTDSDGTKYTGATTTSVGNTELSDRGAVAKHGRMQFGTGVIGPSGTMIPSEHTVLDAGNHWLKKNNSRSFVMKSDWIFLNEHQYKQDVYEIYGPTTGSGSATGLSGTKELQLQDVTGLKKGMLFFPSTDTTYGNTKIPTGTKITKVIKKTNKVQISAALTGSLGTNTKLYVVNKFIETLTQTSPAGRFLQDRPVLEGTVRDFFDTSTSNTTTPNGSLKSSALSITGPFNVTALSSATVTEYDASGGTYKAPGHSFAVGDTVTITGLIGNIVNPNGTSVVDYTNGDFFSTQDAPTSGIPSASLTGQSGYASVEGDVSKTNDIVSYVYKNYAQESPKAYSFGTRMRIIGRPVANAKENERVQEPVGADLYATITNKKGTFRIDGTGGGIAIQLNDPVIGENDVPVANHNVGYYFEIDALSNNSIIDSASENKDVTTIPNVFFYKVMKGETTGNAIPNVLWYSSAPILVDDGLFIGQQKSKNTKNGTVFDLSIEIEELAMKNGKYRRKFFLFINGEQVQIVQDDDAIPYDPNKNGNIGLFVRGKGKVLFEHMYVIGENPRYHYESPMSPLQKKSAFVDSKLDNNNYRRYLVNPSILDTYLSEIGPQQLPRYTMMFEEFGSIMRECAYFDVRYEKAFPALYSKISPTLNDSQGYVISNFRANPYGAQFLVFNATDFALNLDESSGNYLRIQGVTFTQQSAHDLTIDEYFNKNSDLNGFKDYSDLNKKYVSLQNSINTNGRHEFTINGAYIQNQDTANKIMKWMVDKIMRPKKSIGVSIFANPMIQLGDIVNINYSVDDVQQIDSTSRFVVYHITYERSSDGPSMTLYLSEVV